MYGSGSVELLDWIQIMSEDILNGSAESKEQSKEEYSLHGTDLQQSMAACTALQHAAFFVQHLRQGMHVLDCGSGPGSITVDLAFLVAPGQVVGIDIGESEVERARGLASERGSANVRFETGNVYNLPFAANTFDAVFSNAVFDHLSKPLEALSEMRRVLKPGGMVAIRAADADGYLIYPHNPAMEKYGDWTSRRKAEQGVNRRIGKQLRVMLQEAGFVRVEASASYDSYGTPDRVRILGNALAATLGSAKKVNELVQRGWTYQAEVDEVAASLRRWAEDPDAFMAQSFGEAIGWCG
jgi:ubiquinone/menaquinone biosynthesis C-methylase UbiE